MFDPALYGDRAPLGILLFQRGMRPWLHAIGMMARTGEFDLVENIPHISPPCGQHGAELLRNGLTFDLVGLSPGSPASYQVGQYRLGLPDTLDFAELESVVMLPGPHLTGGQRMLPGIRVATALLAELSHCPGLVAMSWVPSGAVVSPDSFRQGITSWLTGGLFPSPPLVSLIRRRDGSLRSLGLHFIIGREFRLDSTEQSNRSGTTIKHAVRLADWLVLQGGFDAPRLAIIPGIGEVRFSILPDGTVAAQPQIK